MLLEDINTTLEQVGMSFTNIVRTWFYNDDILSWYPQFNQARSAFFANNNIKRATCPAKKSPRVDFLTLKVTSKADSN